MKAKQRTSSTVCNYFRRNWLCWFSLVLLLWCAVQVCLPWLYPSNCDEISVVPGACTTESAPLPPRHSSESESDASVELKTRLEEAIQTHRRPLLVRFKSYMDNSSMVYVGYGGVTALEILRPYGYEETESHEWVGKGVAESMVWLHVLCK